MAMWTLIISQCPPCLLTLLLSLCFTLFLSISKSHGTSVGLVGFWDPLPSDAWCTSTFLILLYRMPPVSQMDKCQKLNERMLLSLWKKTWKLSLNEVICICHENHQLTKNITVKYINQSVSSNNQDYLMYYLFRHTRWSTKQASAGLRPLKCAEQRCISKSNPQIVQFTRKLIFCWVLLLLETWLISWMAFKIRSSLFDMDCCLVQKKFSLYA